MPVTFKVPKSPEKSVYQINEFKGVDFSNSPANIDDNKSPNAINMIRDVPDKVRKRMGYETIMRFDNLIVSTAATSGIFTVGDDKSVDIDASSITSIEYDEEDNPISPVNTLELMASLALKKDETYILSSGKEYEPTEHSRAFISLVSNSEEVACGYDIEYTPEENITVTVNLKFVGGIDEITVYPQMYNGGKVPDTYIAGFSGSHNINGVHFRREDTKEIYHVGTNMIKDGEIIYTGANDEISHSWQFNTNLYIMDGKAMLKYDGETLGLCSTNSYIPTLTISKEPSGGGQEYEAINLLQPAFIELFTVTEETKTATQFCLTFGDLGSAEVYAWVLNNSGEWVAKTENTDFTVNRETGVVTFATAPGKSPLNGEDNVKIQAERGAEDVAAAQSKINKCKFGTRFGVNGAFDRLFVSGNPDFPNSDWYSEQWDCSYWPDTGYSLLGSSRSAIVGYSIISNYLAAHKDEMEQDLSIVLREGDLVDDKPSFKIINTLQGAGAIATNSFAYLCTEPLFLTRSGLYAVTAQDITGEKYAQSRSFYLNGRLTEEKFEDLQKSVACIFNDMYLLSVDHDRLYVLDGLQPIRTDKSEPYSTRQYVGFYCDNLPIHYMWERENRLFFGTQSGKVCRFFKDKEDLYSYNDEGEAIHCQWETPDIDGQLFYKNKSLRYIAVRVGAAIATSLEVWVMDRGIWKFVKKDTSFGRYLSFQYLQFSKVAFSGNKTQKVSRTKVRVKRVDKYRLRFINNELNEPFSLYNIANEYTERGNYKG
jgi:hypothetical protein